jgi:hypothetical protein
MRGKMQNVGGVNLQKRLLGGLRARVGLGAPVPAGKGFSQAIAFLLGAWQRPKVSDGRRLPVSFSDCKAFRPIEVGIGKHYGRRILRRSRHLAQQVAAAGHILHRIFLG